MRAEKADNEIPASEQVPAEETALESGAPSPNGARRIPEYPPDILFIVRSEGTVLYVNRPLGSLPEEDVIGSSIYDWVFPDQHDLTRDCLAQVFATGRAHGHELQGLQLHDPEAWYECRVSANMRDHDVVSATIIARDITRHRRAEDKLRARHEELERLFEERTADLHHALGQLSQNQEQREAATQDLIRFRGLMDAAGEAIFVVDARSHCLLDLNQTAGRWLRAPREQLVGQPIADLGLGFPLLPPTDAEVHFTETRDTRRPLMLDGVHRRADGTDFPVEVAVAEHLLDGAEVVLAVVRDVKGRQVAEEEMREVVRQYRALFEASLDPIYFASRAGRILEANPAALECFGYEQEQLIGLDARELMPRVGDVRAFQRAIGEQGSVHDLRVMLRSRDGAEVPARMSALSRRDGHGRLEGYLCLVRLEQAARGTGHLEPPPARTRSAVVLLVDDNRAELAEARQALDHAGMTVLAAESQEEGLELLERQGSAIGAAVLGAGSRQRSLALARDVHLVRASLPIVLVGPGEAPDPGEIDWVRAFLKRPAHPLALVQAVREAMDVAVA